ncbi:hypothetical protein NDU88_007671 [Pleurodeles waltl]|uniref:Uncharacterized protein n=1 Tax=Pleurodeles waltl TaxID=8319 RepID=A0AAV7N2Q0_PLEWA|nr:hypothetical protein NDU88_007671 [Pleurodeles waltl]
MLHLLTGAPELSSVDPEDSVNSVKASNLCTAPAPAEALENITAAASSAFHPPGAFRCFRPRPRHCEEGRSGAHPALHTDGRSRRSGLLRAQWAEHRGAADVADRCWMPIKLG